MSTFLENMPLGSKTIIRTSDRDEALQFATEAVSDMNVEYRQSDGHFEYHLSGDRLGSLDVMSMEMHIGGGADMTVNGLEDDFFLELPTLGQSVTKIGRSQNTVAPGQFAVIHGPDQKVLWQDAGFRYRALSFKISGSVLRKRLVQYAGCDTELNISFEPFVDLQSPGGRAVERILHTAVELLELRDTVFATPANSVLFEEFAANCILTSLPNSATPLLEKPVRATSAVTVRRVEEFIEAHLDEPISLSDLATVAGVSIRSLQRGFQDHFNVSPMRYLRDKRLDRVRVRLMAAAPYENVSQIAFASGFTHLGSFGAEYKRRFGETPSQTLAREKP